MRQVLAGATPLWPGELTAWGTLAVAVAAVAVALFAEWRAGVRVRAEREHSAKVLAAEREAADKRLLKQMEHSDGQLRAQADAARDAEQVSEAYSVQVVLGERINDDTRVLVLMISNRGRYTISRLEAQFSTNGQGLVPHRSSRRLSDIESMPLPLRALIGTRSDTAYGNVLTPWDAGVRFESDAIHIRHISEPYGVIRWTDRWGQRWEHKKGDVHRVDESAPMSS